MKLYPYLVVWRNILKYSFFPPKKYYRGDEKTAIVKFWELLAYFFKTGGFNDMYYAYGLNLKGSSPAGYIAKKQMNRMLVQNNNRLRQNPYQKDTTGYDILTKDKFYLAAILKSQGLPVIDHMGFISNNRLIDGQKHAHSTDRLFQMEMPYLLKNTILEYNEGLLFVEHNGGGVLVNGKEKSKEALQREVAQGTWIVQPVHRSSEPIRHINASALNTTRIVTVLDHAGPVYLTGFQAFATGVQVTDCWDKGSVYVGFDPQSETLAKYGFYHPAYPGESRVAEHPQSKVRFQGYKIPGLAAAVDLCIRAHRYFYYTWLIGWDVAITDHGPQILEANEKPGMNAVQCVNGGLTQRFLGNGK